MRVPSAAHRDEEAARAADIADHAGDVAGRMRQEFLERLARRSAGPADHKELGLLVLDRLGDGVEPLARDLHDDARGEALTFRERLELQPANARARLLRSQRSRSLHLN